MFQIFSPPVLPTGKQTANSCKSLMLCKQSGAGGHLVFAAPGGYSEKDRTGAQRGALKYAHPHLSSSPSKGVNVVKIPRTLWPVGLEERGWENVLASPIEQLKPGCQM